MQRQPTSIEGCFEIVPRVFSDDRGMFVKIFQQETYKSWGVRADFSEQFYSVSRRGVLRGMHFQVPPFGQIKLVTCVAGTILDAVVDLRVGTPSYGRHALVELDARRGNALYVPEGLAHGFLAVSESATVLYSTAGAYSPAHEAGIRWDSAGIAWPQTKPILAPRDAGFMGLGEFKSPFAFTPAANTTAKT